MNQSNKNVREPSEVEAWKIMMDSMVKFIAASTKLMKTIASQAESSEFEKCEDECILCRTRSPKECGVCSVKSVNAPTMQSEGPAINKKSPPPNAPHPVENEKIHATTQEEERGPKKQAAPGKEEGAEKQEGAEGAEKQEGAEEPKAAEEPEGAEEPKAAEEPNEAEEPKAAEKPKETTGTVDPTVAEKEPDTAKSEKPSESDEQQARMGKNYCVCSEVRLIKDEAAKAGVSVDRTSKIPGSRKEGGICRCTGKGGKCGGKKVVNLKEGQDRSLCACDVGPVEKEQMTIDLANKLKLAQDNLAMLQMDMARLQQLDASKNTQSAALYREIMKDNSLEKPSRSRIAARTGISRSSGSTKNPVGQRLLFDEEPCTVNSCPQKQSAPDIHDIWYGAGGYGVHTVSPVQPVQPLPQGRIPQYAKQSSPTYMSSSYPSTAYYKPDILDAPQRKRTPYRSRYDDSRGPSILDEGFLNHNDDYDNTFASESQGSYHAMPQCSAFLSRQQVEINEMQRQGSPPVLRTPQEQAPRPFHYATATAKIPKYKLPERPGTHQRFYQQPPFPKNVCQGECYTGEYVAPETQSDYVNPEFGTESQEFPGEDCYDGHCENECYAEP